MNLPKAHGIFAMGLVIGKVNCRMRAFKAREKYWIHGGVGILWDESSYLHFVTLWFLLLSRRSQLFKRCKNSNDAASVDHFPCQPPNLIVQAAKQNSKSIHLRKRKDAFWKKMTSSSIDVIVLLTGHSAVGVSEITWLQYTPSFCHSIYQFVFVGQVTAPQWQPLSAVHMPRRL